MSRIIAGPMAGFWSSMKRRWSTEAAIAGLDDHLRADIGLGPAPMPLPLSPLVKAWMR